MLLARQRLAGERASANADGVLDVVRDLGCLQLDPINVVARSHLLMLWSRIGPYDPAILDSLLWERRELFEYWAQAASIVLTEDYPLHHLLMRNYPKGDSLRRRRVRAWMEDNRGLRRHILVELRRRGPLRSRDFEDRSAAGWESTGWTGGRNVGRMLDFLWTQGRIMVARRVGLEKWWDLSECVLPSWVPRERLGEREVVRRAAQRSLRGLGIARAKDIEGSFTAGRYPNLPRVMAELERAGRIEQVRVAADGQAWPDTWFVHEQDLGLLERLSAGEWEPRTTLLSPFDPVTRGRVELLFGFAHRMEIYVPKEMRRYGYYVMPILHGDRLIGRMDPALDRRRGRLEIHAIHAEPGAPRSLSTARAIAGAVEELATFLRARDVAYVGPVPEGWRRALG
jgi:uncharacterized protein YcaQ